MGKHALTMVDWKPHERNSLRGFATVKIPELRMVVHGVAMHELGAKRWAQLPSKPLVVDDQPARHANGNIKYVPIVEITDRETAIAFSQACWSALDAYQKSQAPHGATIRRGFFVSVKTRRRFEMANPKVSCTHVNTTPSGRITKTGLRRIYGEVEPLTQLDFFVDRDGVAARALDQLRQADRRAEAAGLNLRPLIRKRK